MGIAKVNIRSVGLDDTLDEFGFRHVQTSVGDRLGARRIGASVYEAEAEAPIWPYHYHHGIEEWLYVIDGAPVLREPAGERSLAPGDLVCFPSGPLGAHTVKGPGRFVIFATGQHVEPYLTVYPDSDKVSGPEGIHLRSSAVGYWHNEGTAGPSEPVEIEREPERAPPRRLEAIIGESAPEPYRYVFGREEWLLVLDGTPVLRHPEGEDRLQAGDLVCFPEGPTGAHQLLGAAARVLSISTTGFPANVHYPDTGEWRLLNEAG